MAYVLRHSLRNQHKQLLILLRNDSTSSTASSSSSSSAQEIKDVPGLSARVVNVPGNEVGPGASKNSSYKNPEYFCYNNTSYFEAELEMQKYRLPQPSNKRKSN